MVIAESKFVTHSLENARMWNNFLKLSLSVKNSLLGYEICAPATSSHWIIYFAIKLSSFFDGYYVKI